MIYSWFPLYHFDFDFSLYIIAILITHYNNILLRRRVLYNFGQTCLWEWPSSCLRFYWTWHKCWREGLILKENSTHWKMSDWENKLTSIFNLNLILLKLLKYIYNIKFTLKWISNKMRNNQSLIVWSINMIAINYLDAETLAIPHFIDEPYYIFTQIAQYTLFSLGS